MNRRDFLALCAAAPLAPSITRPTSKVITGNAMWCDHGRTLTQTELTRDMLDDHEAHVLAHQDFLCRYDLLPDPGRIECQ